MVSSYLLSTTVVPVLATWLMREKHGDEERQWWRRAYAWYAGQVVRWRWPVVGAYVVVSGLLLWLLIPRVQTEFFPGVDAGQFRLRLRGPTGTRIERTELIALKALEVIKREAGPENVAISTGFIGVQPPSYPINTIYLWTSGPHEAVMLVALKPSATLRGEALKERLREKLRETLPGTEISFEAGDIVSQVMSFGSPTPIEVAVQGIDIAASRQHAAKIRAELEKIPELRDLQYAQPLDYPTIDVKVNRERAGQFGLTASGIATSMVEATSSSRFIEPNYWRDPASGNGFQIQVEIPQNRMKSMEDVASLPVMSDGSPRPLLADVAELTVRVTDCGDDVDRVFYAATGQPLVTAAEAARIVAELIPGSSIEVSDTMTPDDEVGSSTVSVERIAAGSSSRWRRCASLPTKSASLTLGRAIPASTTSNSDSSSAPNRR